MARGGTFEVRVGWRRGLGGIARGGVGVLSSKLQLVEAFDLFFHCQYKSIELFLGRLLHNIENYCHISFFFVAPRLSTCSSIKLC